MIKSIINECHKPIAAYVGSKQVWQYFTPTDLFLNGEQGVWFDPSDLSTMFQDVGGLEPVTKDGDPVALIKDKSGNGNHAIQETASARPIYRTDGNLHWLEFDGVDDTLKTTELPFYSEVIASVGFKAITNGNRLAMDNTILGTTGGAFARAGIVTRNDSRDRSVGGYIRVVNDISAISAIVTDPNTRFFRPMAITSSSVSGKIKTLSEEGIIESAGDVPKSKGGAYPRAIAIAPGLSGLGSIAFYGGVFVINPKNEESLENLQLFMQDITGEG